ncbi:MAG: AAA family ATPase [Planctomycetes bacterium]|nr:AAA family ATPase [Planctomycetota bacterium]
MTCTQKLSEYIRACFTGIWIESPEPQEVLQEIRQLCTAEQWKLAVWDMENGGTVPATNQREAIGDPLGACRWISTLAQENETTVIVLQNFHPFLQSPEIIQALSQQILLGKQTRTMTIIVSPVTRLPIELEKAFVVIEHQLPTRSDLLEIAQGLTTVSDELPNGRALEQVLDAAVGLTRMEAENAMSLSLVREGKISPDALWELKSQMLKKSGSLTLSKASEDFSSLGGLVSLKAFCKRALMRSSESNPLKRPRGVMLLSPPGCGKSQFCRLLGSEVGRPVLMLDVGSLLGSLVGQSEERTRQALRIADAMAPCILMIDEVEKAFSGAQSSGDSGVSSRLFGTFLTWLNDHTSDVFVVCTSNDISRLPPEFSRSERFDGVFFIDLPEREEKDVIWNLYRNLYGIDPNQTSPRDDQWTGAEIKSCCRLSAMLDVPLAAAASHVVPVAVTAAESIEKLRAWASGRCLSASQAGIYTSKEAKNTRRRKINTDPSNN